MIVMILLGTLSLRQFAFQFDLSPDRRKLIIALTNKTWSTHTVYIPSWDAIDYIPINRKEFNKMKVMPHTGNFDPASSVNLSSFVLIKPRKTIASTIDLGAYWGNFVPGNYTMKIRYDDTLANTISKEDKFGIVSSAGKSKIHIIDFMIDPSRKFILKRVFLAPKALSSWQTMTVHKSGATLNTFTYQADSMKRAEKLGATTTTLIWDGSDYLQGRS